jgi:heme-degrading monooxygenase HmoA
VIISRLTFELVPGSFDALAAAFARHGILERAIQVEGCRSLYLAADTAHEGRAHVVGVWEDEEAYQRWIDHPQRSVGTADLRALMSDTWDPSAPGEVWNVLHAVDSTLDRLQPSGTCDKETHQ